MPSVVDQAVCVRQWDWSETSQTVSLFGRETGLLRAVAKGSKRQDPRFSGGLETCTLGEAVAIVKPSLSLATLTAWDLREPFPRVRRSLSAFYSAMFILDLVQHTLTERDPHPLLFDDLVETLGCLGGAQGPKGDRLAVLRFQWSNLSETGYRPELERDVAGGDPIPRAVTYAFSPMLGGFTVDRAAGEPRSYDGLVWRVRSETLSVLRALEADKASAGLAGRFSDVAITRASRLLASFVRENLGKDLPGMGAFFGGRGAPGLPPSGDPDS